jgi:phage terminase large subunit-like protein
MTTARKISATLAQRLRSDWHSRARPEQLAPPGDWTTWLLMAGRGFGKTLSGSSWINGEVEAGVRRVALVGATERDVRATMVEGPSGILATAPSWNRPVWESSKRKLTWPNGAIGNCYSSEQPDRLRGPEHEIGWLDELAAFEQLDETYTMFSMGLRVGKRPRAMISTTPRPLPLIKALVKRDGQDVVVVRGATYANRANLAPSFFETIIRKYENTRIGRQELNAELLLDTPGALWTYDLCEQCRVAKAPPMKRVCIAVDPAVSTNEDSDETGLVVCGIGEDNHGYVIEDLSGKYSPVEWARRACMAYRLHQADTIVAEANMGGNLVMETLRSVDKNIPCRLVHAAKGKYVRAEPVSSLFEQHRCHFAGTFPILEDQCCSFEPGAGSSPDRMDAMVWGLSLLMLGFETPLTFTAPFISRTRYGVDALPQVVRDPESLEHPLQARGEEYRTGGIAVGGLPASLKGL